MKLRLLKLALVQVATALVLLVATFLAYAELASHSGRAKAEALCLTMPVGSDVKVAEAAIASADIDSRMRFSSTERMGGGFHGAFLDRWFCYVAISEGKIVGTEVRLID